MSATPTTFALPWGSLTICADWSQARSQIRYLDDDGAEHSTPHQVADARHDPREGLRLVLRHLGRGYYASPDDDRDDAAIVDELVAGAQEAGR